MKTINTLLQAHLTQEVTTLAMCWKLTRRDGVAMGFTNLDRDVEVDGFTYVAESGFSAGSAQSRADMGQDDLTLEGLLDSEAISEKDIQAGKYDYAEIEVFVVNYNVPDDGVVNLRTGWLGEVQVSDGIYKAELHGIGEKLNRTIGELYSPACRAQLGDERCGVDVSVFTISGSVSEVTSQQVFQDDDRNEVAGFFTQGLITFTSGLNDGLSMEVKEYKVSGEITLALPLPYAIAAGDDYTMVAGCDKTVATCRDRYANVVNFRGEPHVPGVDRILETSTTRS